MYKPENTDINPQVLRYDKDARFTRKGFVGYKVHRMVDHKYGIVLSDIATPGNVPDPNVVPDIIRDFKLHFKIQHKYLVEDSGYKDQYTLNFATTMGYDVYLPMYRNSNAKNSEMFGVDKFKYNKEKKVLICPEGKELAFRRHREDKGIYEFKANAKECNACPQKEKCTSSDRGRTSSISEHEELMQLLINKRRTPKYKTLMRNRQIYSEGSFAEAKELHGMDKARLKGLEKMNIQMLMSSILQNIKKFIKYVQKPKTETGKLVKRGEVQVILSLTSLYYKIIYTYISVYWYLMNCVGACLAA